MTITVARFSSAALPKELHPIICLVQKMYSCFYYHCHFPNKSQGIVPLKDHRPGSHSNPPSALFFQFLSLYFSLPLSLSHFVYIQTLRSRGELASELSLHTTQFRLQISQDIQCTHGFINTEFEPCLPSSIRVISYGRTMPNTSPVFSLCSVSFRLALTVTLPPS